MSEFRLSEKEKLQGATNFPIWFATIEDYLKSKKLHKYIKYELNELMITPERGSKLTKEEVARNQDTIANDAAACTVIFSNVSDMVKMYIKDCPCAKSKMDKLKALYQRDESAFHGMWMNRLYSIRAKHIQETMDVINEIKELFRLLSNSLMNPSDMEKLSIMYDALPASLQQRVNFSSELTVEDFYKEIKNKYMIYMFKFDRGTNQSRSRRPSSSNYSQNTNTPDFKDCYDPMDIDNVETGKNKKQANDRNLNKNDKYCIICFNKGHIAKDCYFNPRGTNRPNHRSKFSNHYKKHKNDNKKETNHYKRGTYNIEPSNRREFTPCCEEIKEMFGEPIGNIEYGSHDQNKEDEHNIDLCTVDINDNQSKNYHVNFEDGSKPVENVSPDQNEEVLSNLFSKISRDQNESTLTFDTGASEHITNERGLLENFKEEKITMSCANNSTCVFEGYGTFRGKINGYEIVLDKVLYSKDINKNLISGIKLAKMGIFSNIKSVNNKTYLNLTNENNTIIAQIVPDNYNIARIKLTSSNSNINSTETGDNLKIWHNRLGHFYFKDINNYLELHEDKETNCKECDISKMKRHPHNKTTPKASRVLETIHSDIMGPIKPASIDGMKYIITFIDEFSRKSWVFLLKEKSEATNTILYFLKYLDNHYNNKVKFFKSDNGREFNNSKIKKYCRRNGIKKIFSPPYNPENNGIAERFNQTIVNSVKTLLYWAKLSLDFWSFAIIYANHLYNITPRSSISNLIPNEIFYNKKVDLSKIKVFGCKSFYNNIQNKKSKFDINSAEGIFLGIQFNTDCYIIMDINNQNLHLVREAKFLENTPGEYSFKYENDHHNIDSNIIKNNCFDSNPINTEPRNQTNNKEIPNKDNNLDNQTDNNKIYSIIQNSSFHYINSISSDIPFSFKQAINSENSEKWIKSISDELDNLYNNNVVTFVRKIPKGRKIISTKWVFSIKRDENNQIVKFKARLVARGFTQEFGIDFDLTYSPTLNSDSLKLLIAIAAKMCWNVFQLDIKAAYLNANLDKTIFVKIPPGDANYNKGYWKLNKALYGLRQSGRQWFETISTFLIDINFIQLKSDSCIFRKYNNKNEIICVTNLVRNSLGCCSISIIKIK